LAFFDGVVGVLSSILVGDFFGHLVFSNSPPIFI